MEEFIKAIKFMLTSFFIALIISFMTAGIIAILRSFAGERRGERGS
jgi:hypothetical protein